MSATSSGVSSASSGVPAAATKTGSKSSGDEHPTEPGAPCDDNIACKVSTRDIPELTSASIPFETENSRVVTGPPNNDCEADEVEAVIVAKR
mmetsp:Transcript_4213/g.9187  ORF Transcript_4213/g.9187 Transcript_4213/m.9187 type:complete len:92 (-) Transcript_4213:167-442(-)